MKYTFHTFSYNSNLTMCGEICLVLRFNKTKTEHRNKTCPSLIPYDFIWFIKLIYLFYLIQFNLSNSELNPCITLTLFVTFNNQLLFTLELKAACKAKQLGLLAQTN